MEVLNKLFYEDSKGTTYYSILNNQGKRWLIGQQNMKTAFELYQPTAIKGKLLKHLFPYVYKCPFVCSAFHIEKRKLSIRPEYSLLFEKEFGENYNIAVFGGTPSIHQKVVIQIYSKAKILGYCKISDSKKVGFLFDCECNNLEYLYKCGIDSIPKVIFRCDKENLSFFCQSSVKKSKGKTIEVITEQHWNFLKNMYEKTAKEMKFEKSDYYALLESLEKEIKGLPKEDAESIQKAVMLIRKKNEGKLVKYGFYHGDFTPWNTVLESGKLSVFDFEYAKRTYPEYLDLVHFFMQTKFFVDKEMRSSEIYLSYGKSSIWEKLGKKEALEIMIEYLMEVINLYLSRAEKESMEEQQRQKIRISILRKAVNEYENLYRL